MFTNTVNIKFHILPHDSLGIELKNYDYINFVQIQSEHLMKG